MSSLAGALVPPRSHSSPTKSVDMHAEAEEEDEGMADLFGQEEEEQEEEEEQ